VLVVVDTVCRWSSFSAKKTFILCHGCYAKNKQVWKDWVFAQRAKACWHKSQQHRFMCKRKSLMSYLLPKLVLKVKQQDDASCCRVCQGGFHSILQKRSGTFYELPWGLYKEMPTNAWGQSDIVSHQTNIWNKVYLWQWTFYHTRMLLLIQFLSG